MTSDSGTPRTDAESISVEETLETGVRVTREWVLARLARELERELAEAKEELSSIRKVVDEQLEPCMSATNLAMDNSSKEIEKLRARLAAAEKVVAAARSHMDGGWFESLPTCGGYHGDGVPCPIAVALKEYDEAGR